MPQSRSSVVISIFPPLRTKVIPFFSWYPLNSSNTCCTDSRCSRCLCQLKKEWWLILLYGACSAFLLNQLTNLFSYAVYMSTSVICIPVILPPFSYSSFNDWSTFCFTQRYFHVYCLWFGLLFDQDEKNIRIDLLSKSDDPINILIPQPSSTSSSSQVAQSLGISSPLPRRRAPAFVGSVCVRLG